MENLSDELITKFSTDLTKELEGQLDYYNFNITSAATEWINSVVEYYKDWISDLSDYDDLDEFKESLDDDEGQEDFTWPTDAEAAEIVSDALRNDTSHFMYITEETGYSMAPGDCFEAEWYWQGSIRPDIINWIIDFLEENIS